VTGTQLKQRLAAILAADVAGYSRLMAADERATVAALDAARAVFRTQIESNQGRVIDMAGDSVLAVFETATGAVSAALSIQQELNASSAPVPEDRRMRFRIGVHMGDVIEKGDGTVYGDGVNIAARLEGLAEAGGITVSESIRTAVRGKVNAVFEDQGEQTVKNIAEPVRAFRVRAEVSTTSKPSPAVEKVEQKILFCSAADGVQLAYSSIGRGSPLVKTGNWMTHLEYDLESPIWRRLWTELAREHTLVRYDARGNGLSDWDVDEISFDTFVSDLETVVDAAKLDQFALLGISQGCAVSIAYAVRHPERVSQLVLYGGFALGGNRRPQNEGEKEQRAAMLTLMRLGWGQDNPAFRQMFTSRFVPDGTKEQADWFNDLQRRATSAENAVRYMEATGKIDVTQLLPQVRMPTLVLHAREDVVAPFDLARRMAAAIPGARLVPLQSKNHLILENEPAFSRFLEEVRLFLK
jgi:class 3 adenylate cyclase/pimeloyl-ACP methyl ester carboxylesterase